MDLVDQAHIAEYLRVAHVIEHRLAGRFYNEAGGIAEIDNLAFGV